MQWQSYSEKSIVRAHRGEVIDFVINNPGDSSGPHPFHMHGHEAWLMGAGVNTVKDRPIVGFLIVYYYYFFDRVVMLMVQAFSTL